MTTSVRDKLVAILRVVVPPVQPVRADEVLLYHGTAAACHERIAVEGLRAQAEASSKLARVHPGPYVISRPLLAAHFAVYAAIRRLSEVSADGSCVVYAVRASRRTVRPVGWYAGTKELAVHGGVPPEQIVACRMFDGWALVDRVREVVPMSSPTEIAPAFAELDAIASRLGLRAARGGV